MHLRFHAHILKGLHGGPVVKTAALQKKETCLHSRSFSMEFAFSGHACGSSLWVLWLVPIVQIYRSNALSNKCVFVVVCPVPLGYHAMD